MMASRRAGRWPLACVSVLLAATGCSARPTYPKAQLAESLQEILIGEHLDASVRFVERTLGVEFSYPGALQQTDAHIGIGPAFDEAIRKVLTAVHRVLLSTDAEVNFYVVLLSDPQIPGAYLTLVRYMDDIRRANANMLDVPEMFARTIYELNYYAGSAPVTIEQYLPRDIRLEEFLSWQLARRIQTALTDTLRPSGVVEVGRCGGKFQNGEFVFTLDVNPASEGPVDDATLQGAFQTSTEVIAKVLSSYQFESFDAIRLIHPLTGRHLVLPKTNLDLFR